MQINIYSITKKDAAYRALQEELCMRCKPFGANIKHFELFPQSVKNAQPTDKKLYELVRFYQMRKTMRIIAFSPWVKGDIKPIRIKIRGKNMRIALLCFI